MGHHAQQPIKSDFHAKSTASEVIEGIDLGGTHAVVTGGYSGIGLETVRALAAAGATVTVPARRPDVAKNALHGLPGEIEIAELDLSDRGSIDRFTANFLKTGHPLSLLINNAGVMASPQWQVGPGWEFQLGINHLGHMTLYHGLRPALRKAEGARVIALSSVAHALTDIFWDDPHFEHASYDKWKAYGQSKTANALFAMGVDQRERDAGIRAFSVHPGGIFTPLQRHLPEEEMIAMGWKNPDGTIPPEIEAMFKTPEQGASTTVWAATSPALNDRGGVYCEDCDIAALATEDSKRWEHVRAWACDPERADRLWTMSESMLKSV